MISELDIQILTLSCGLSTAVKFSSTSELGIKTILSRINTDEMVFRYVKDTLKSFIAKKGIQEASTLLSVARYTLEYIIEDKELTAPLIRSKQLNKYRCEICGLRLNHTNLIKRHIIEEHAKISLFPCDLCNMKFNTEQQLNAHKKVHVGAKRYVCDEEGCNFTTPQVSILRNHFYSKHPLRNLDFIETCIQGDIIY